MNDSTRSNDTAEPRLRHALRTLPGGEPPMGFARAVAAMAEGDAQRARGERRWLLLPVLVFLPAAAIMAVRDGDGWQAAAAALVEALGGAAGLGWVGAMGGCLALSWALSRLRAGPRRHRA
jgi:hypothetical protein